MKDEHNIDQLFKAGLGDPEIPFNEMDWEKMSKKLDAHEKRRMLPVWWFVGAGIAATVLIFLFTILLEEEPVNKKLLKAKTQNPNKETVEKRVHTEEPVDKSSIALAAHSNKEVHRNKSINGLESGNQIGEPGASKIQLVSTNPLPANVLASDFQLSGPKGDTAQFIPMKAAEAYVGVHTGAKVPVYANVKRSGLTFSIMAAPDISGTGANLSSKVSTNIGLLVTYPLSRKISVSTGVIYAKKLYNSAGPAAINNGYGNQSWEVNADCRVLDIPLNVNYQVFKKRKLSISVNTGLSSYLMLNERYDLTSGPDRSASRVEVSNQNQHLFGVANLSVSVERKINSSLSIGVQPFVKLPLTGIGNYDIRLNSTGVSVFMSFSKLKL
ncbi:hypothetical protein SAMN05421820_104308 [Pedobacter steynii]|uniref:Outer membrane protein beta-barrel domain-containing protein n=1 Tax=Pedobacter steynii TaxID=430522 RepID=A0A1G9UWU2_9SPHI|nr:outer membrane beta-barrel protein [Pedobacter steynii]NQX40903.1 hypothetical protein [Pedobacter steynii]SDM64309.1 hypothetical protein SAMN05421820_104308 [Pedobacter steynii]